MAMSKVHKVKDNKTKDTYLEGARWRWCVPVIVRGCLPMAGDANRTDPDQAGQYLLQVTRSTSAYSKLLHKYGTNSGLNLCNSCRRTTQISHGSQV